MSNETIYQEMKPVYQDWGMNLWSILPKAMTFNIS